jgi:phosphoribosylanthranilate isomerase
MTRVRVKVCGLTRLDDAERAVESGADAIGFVLWPRSPRHIAVAAAAAIARRLAPFVTRVGVFVNASVGDVESAVRDIGLDAVQLHGDESAMTYAQVGARLIKAVAPMTDEETAGALNQPAEVTLLVDAADMTSRGGTGRQADWTRAAALARVRPIILAGGLTTENIAEAIDRVHPWAVDVSSGVEDAPGRKNAQRMRAFLAAVRDSRPQEVP